VIFLPFLSTGKHPDWFDPELVPKLRSFCQHYGVVILPTKPYMPRHKGKVEAGVKYVQNNALKARKFGSLQEQNEYLTRWEATVADTRIHGTTRQHVGKVFREAEQPALQPLPLERFAMFQEAPRKVSRDGHIEVAKSYYSAPPEYLGREVWARWDQRLVRIFNQRFEQIDLHLRVEPGRFSTHAYHLVPEKINGIERGVSYLLTQVRNIGPEAHQWAEAMLVARGIEGTRVLQGLISLARRHNAEELENACKTALSYGVFQLRPLRKLLGRKAQEQTTLSFLSEHPIIRPLFLGPPGVGKSFLVQAIGYQAIKQGHVVLYRSIFDVVRDFFHEEALADEKVLAKYRQELSPAEPSGQWRWQRWRC
jgi:hypothetical protein